MARGDQNDPGSGHSPDIRVNVLRPAQWQLVRRLRRRALRESPDALAPYEREAQWQSHDWARTFDAGRWFVANADRRAVGLARSLPEPAKPWQRNIESVWVAPGFRGRGIARRLVDAVIEFEVPNGVTQLLAWVLDGNDRARVVYRRLGFEPARVQQPFPGWPGRTEERFVRRLAAD